VLSGNGFKGRVLEKYARRVPRASHALTGSMQLRPVPRPVLVVTCTVWACQASSSEPAWMAAMQPLHAHSSITLGLPF